MSDVNPAEVSDIFKGIVAVSGALMATVVGWVGVQVKSNTDKTTENEKQLALIDQSLSSHRGRVNAIADKVETLNTEVTGLKFSIMEMRHEMSANHQQLMHKMSNKPTEE